MLAEESLQLRVGDLRERGGWRRPGEIVWTGTNTYAKYVVTAYADEAEVRLTAVRNGQFTEQTMPCVTTEQRIGLRWWFLCPVCGRRVGVLYLPPGQARFACRHCYRIIYRSQLHDLDFILKPIAAEAGVPKRVARAYVKSMVRGAGIRAPILDPAIHTP